MGIQRIGRAMVWVMAPWAATGDAHGGEIGHNSLILNRYQAQELAREQARYRRGLGPLDPAERRELARRLQAQRLEQRALQRRSHQRAQALERSAAPGRELRGAEALQRLRRDQRQRRLELRIQRRAWPHGR